MNITPQEIRELLDYNQETGRFTWRSRKIRPDKACYDRSWNTRYANKQIPIYTKLDIGYALISLFKKFYYAHRIAWFHFHGEHAPKGMHIDHINGDKTDNRIANLRLATVAQNVQNQKLHRDNTSGFKGVNFHKPTKKWMARIKANNEIHYLGIFETPEEASVAYMAASKRLHGEFSNLG